MRALAATFWGLFAAYQLFVTSVMVFGDPHGTPWWQGVLYLLPWVGMLVMAGLIWPGRRWSREATIVSAAWGGLLILHSLPALAANVTEGGLLDMGWWRWLEMLWPVASAVLSGIAAREMRLSARVASAS
ncbi:MAG: hypothetical protein OEW24_08260 [Chloroflexota bacterium]|nr:hypothetical protein [Chloroflexota bacterium]